MEFAPESTNDYELEQAQLDDAESFLKLLLQAPFSPAYSTAVARHTRVESLRRHRSLSQAADELYALLKVLEDPSRIEVQDADRASVLVEDCIRGVELQAAELDVPILKAKINSERSRRAAHVGHTANRERKARLVDAYHAGKFSSKDKAAELLAEKFGYSVRQAREHLKGK